MKGLGKEDKVAALLVYKLLSHLFNNIDHSKVIQVEIFRSINSRVYGLTTPALLFIMSPDCESRNQVSISISTELHKVSGILMVFNNYSVSELIKQLPSP